VEERRNVSVNCHWQYRGLFQAGKKDEKKEKSKHFHSPY